MQLGLGAVALEQADMHRRILNHPVVLQIFVKNKKIYWYEYQFATIGQISVVHIWPNDMSSFTMYGSFNAVDSALDRFQPKYVFSVGVAFGIDPSKQSLGDVLVAKNLVFYDSFNKITDGTIKLRPDDTW